MTRAWLLVVALSASACAPALMKLPAAPGVPAPDASAALESATTACRGVRTLTAEVAVSGSVGGQGLRGRLLTGLAAPASARLEAVAPFGQPVFIFVAAGQEATLVLPRDERVLQHGRPEAVLEAVTGVPLGPADLRHALTGCPPAAHTPEGRQAGDQWRVIDAGDSSVYLHRDANVWTVAAIVHAKNGREDWRAEYRDVQSGIARTVRLVSADPKRFDLRLALSQVEINTPLDADVFRVRVPESAMPISLDELRAAGPLRGKTDSGGAVK